MDSQQSDDAPLACDLKLPDFYQPLAEHWPLKMSWSQAMRHFEPMRRRYMREFDSPEKRLLDKNPEPFVLP
jgi:hypothetical protein